MAREREGGRGRGKDELDQNQACRFTTTVVLPTFLETSLFCLQGKGAPQQGSASLGQDYVKHGASHCGHVLAARQRDHVTVARQRDHVTSGALQAKLLVAELLEDNCITHSCVCCMDYSLAKVVDNVSERILPGIHLYHSNTSDDFVHDPHTFVCDLSRFQP